MAPNIQHAVKEQVYYGEEIPNIKAVLLGPPGSGKGTQVIN